MQQYVREGFVGGTTGVHGQQTPGQPVGQAAEAENRQSGQSAQTPPRFCRKCFLREMELQGGLKASYQNMLERIEMMDSELRCTGEAYDARLAQCKKCEYLAEGMCALCGCFAESRAAVKANSCPAEPKRWEAEVIEGEII